MDTETCAGEHSVYWFRLVLALASSNILLVTVIFILLWQLYKYRNVHHHEDGSEIPREVSPSAATDNQNQETDMLNYASVSFAHQKAPRQSREKRSRSVVYSEVKYCQQD
ncbi:hypothetical protein MATL_G00174740 [Megalops atlanticus]|uniref:Uncharacterized protein n=1 Tax=Megalops atlanticus TaxID=7932 RepID=A0A9D3PUG1_MEGAT|nr:hypothetical protein MATL_G00174740 [Megalops atlanticus]